MIKILILFYFAKYHVTDMAICMQKKSMIMNHSFLFLFSVNRNSNDEIIQLTSRPIERHIGHSLFCFVYLFAWIGSAYHSIESKRFFLCCCLFYLNITHWTMQNHRNENIIYCLYSSSLSSLSVSLVRFPLSFLLIPIQCVLFFFFWRKNKSHSMNKFVLLTD